MKLKINPRLWQLDAWKSGDVVVTHKPEDYPQEVAEELLPLRYQGLPLVVEVAPEPVARPLRSRRPRRSSDNEVSSEESSSDE